MNINLENRIKKLINLKENKFLMSAFVFLIVISFIFSDRSEPKDLKIQKIEADTIIPKGFVLVPIDLENIDSVSGVINQFGVIDLYTGKNSGQKSIKIASRIKILRAPLNPNQFAVLVPEFISDKIMQVSGPFWAVIQNRSTPNENFKEEVPITNKKIEIEYLERTNL